MRGAVRAGLPGGSSRLPPRACARDRRNTRLGLCLHCPSEEVCCCSGFRPEEPYSPALDRSKNDRPQPRGCPHAVVRLPSIQLGSLRPGRQNQLLENSVATDPLRAHLPSLHRSSFWAPIRDLATYLSRQVRPLFHRQSANQSLRTLCCLALTARKFCSRRHLISLDL